MNENPINQLAHDHYNRKLDVCEAYVALAESAFRLRDAAQAWIPPQHDRYAFETIDNCASAGASQGECILRLADREIAELDSALRGYGYRLVFASERAMIDDARKRIAYLRAGKTYGIYEAGDEG